MTASRDPDRLIRAFLVEGDEELHDQVYDAVRARIEQSPQRFVIGPWRLPVMNKLVGFGLAAAAVILAVLVGTRLLGSPEAGGFGGSPSRSAEAAPATAEPTASEPSPSSDGSLPQGPHTLWDGANGGPSITVTIPASGWYGEPGGGILANAPSHENFAPEDAGMIGPFVGDIYVPADPCQWTTTMPDDPATTVDEVAAALQRQATRAALGPNDVDIDGYTGKALTLHVPDDAVFSDCDRGEFCTLSEGNPEACNRYEQFPGQIDELWIMDVDEEVVVIDATYGNATPSGDIAALRAIVDSMDFE